MPDRTHQSSLSFPYAYQGQEKDPTTGMVDFELRRYDPRIGRWYNPDPYGQHHSPYLAMSNNPVSSIDPDGGWDNSGWNEDGWNGSLYTNSVNQHNPDAYGGSEFDRQYSNSGPWGGSIGANGSYTSNDSWIAGAHDNWKAGQNNDYFETNVYKDSEGGVIGFSDANIVGYRTDPMYDYIARKGKAKESAFIRAMDKALGRGLWSRVDKALGEGLFGKDGYSAVKKNAGDNNPYMYTRAEMQEQATQVFWASTYSYSCRRNFSSGKIWSKLASFKSWYSYNNSRNKRRNVIILVWFRKN